MTQFGSGPPERAGGRRGVSLIESARTIGVGRRAVDVVPGLGAPRVSATWCNTMLSVDIVYSVSVHLEILQVYMTVFARVRVNTRIGSSESTINYYAHAHSRSNVARLSGITFHKERDDVHGKTIVYPT